MTRDTSLIHQLKHDIGNDLSVIDMGFHALRARSAREDEKTTPERS